MTNTTIHPPYMNVHAEDAGVTIHAVVSSGRGVLLAQVTIPGIRNLASHLDGNTSRFSP